MPRGDGTGPPWGGDSDTSKGSSIEGRGFGRMIGTSPGAGPGGDCFCPICGAKIPHQAGIPCYNLSCPKCGAKMVRC